MSTSPSTTLRTARRPKELSLGSRSFRTSPHSQYSRRDAPSEPSPIDFGQLDVLGNTPAPATSVDVCMHDGFGLNSGLTISDGNGVLLVGGEAFVWRPWVAKDDLKLANNKGQFDLPAEAFGMFDMLWPRPGTTFPAFDCCMLSFLEADSWTADLLIIGVGKSNMPLSPQTRQRVAELGIRVDVLDTRNAASQFNLLATERGVTEVAAALIPLGWEDGRGVK